MKRRSKLPSDMKLPFVVSAWLGLLSLLVGAGSSAIVAGIVISFFETVENASNISHGSLLNLDMMLLMMAVAALVCGVRFYLFATRWVAQRIDRALPN